MTLTQQQKQENWDKAAGGWRRDGRRARVSGLAEQIGREPLPRREPAELAQEQREHKQSLRKVWDKSLEFAKMRGLA